LVIRAQEGKQFRATAIHWLGRQIALGRRYGLEDMAPGQSP